MNLTPAQHLSKPHGKRDSWYYTTKSLLCDSFWFESFLNTGISAANLSLWGSIIRPMSNDLH